ncbi:hypothetical protein [Micromonospora sagamiensis]|uniref:hypothetical protein n=1 Tax=Micromonospora sagamiensis TaxID=47875 RepID=UPI0016811062|nr:hypothetical protein [Micromonospora sagamiensis]BCL14223.1 hypothetical protein GCM10017556_19620 [Micromonospora sagamiensis]
MTGPVQTGYAPPSGPPSPPARGWPRWLIVATLLWALLLAALTWLSVRDDGPTVREQRTLAEAGPVVDRAIGDLVAAAGPDALVELAKPVVERGCRVTPFADGGTLERLVDVRVPGEEPRALLDRLAGALPDRYRAAVLLTREGSRLRADAGEFVAVQGQETEEGTVRLTADSGCRPLGSGYEPTPVTGADAEADAVAVALRVLGRPSAGGPDLVAAPCPGGGSARTARATAGPGAPTSAAAVLAPLAAGAPLVDTPDLYAYRVGPVTVQVHLAADPLAVTASTPCR